MHNNYKHELTICFSYIAISIYGENHIMQFNICHVAQMRVGTSIEVPLPNYEDLYIEAAKVYRMKETGQGVAKLEQLVHSNPQSLSPYIV